MVTPAGYTLFSTIPFLTVPLAGDGTTPKSPGFVVVISLYQRGYTGASVELYGSENPLKLDQGDDDLPGLKPTKITIGFISKAGRELKDFFADDDRQFFVSVLREDGIPAHSDFHGWLSPFSARETYAQYGAVEMSATDGLGGLTDFSYRQYPSGLPFPGTRLLSGFVNFSLKWLGYQLPIWYNDHLIEEADWIAPTGSQLVPQHPGPAANPYQINQVDAARWIDDQGNYLPCKTVLDDLSEARYLRIQQHKGVWKISHLPDFAGRPDFSGATTDTIRYWNTYAIDGLFSTPLSEKPERIVYKDADGKPIVGSNVEIDAAKRRYEETFEYGGLPSQLINGGFIGTAGTVPNGWTYTGPNDIAAAGSGKIVGTGQEKDPYRVRMLGLKNGDPKRSFYPDQKYLNILQQSVILVLDPGAKRKITISGNYINHLTAGAALEVIVELGQFTDPNDPNSFLVLGDRRWNLQADGSWGYKKDASTVLYLHYTNLLPDGVGNGKTYYFAKPTSGEPFSITSEAIPAVPPNLQNDLLRARVIISLWPGPDYDTPASHGGSYTDYFNLNLIQEEATLVDLTKEIVTVQVPGLDIRARLKTEQTAIKLGDQTTVYAVPPKPIRPGAYLRFDGKTPTRRWMTFYLGHIDKIQNQIARARLIQTQVHRPVFDGTLLGDIGPLDVLVFPELGGKKAIISTYSLNVRTRQVEVRTVGLPSDLDRQLDPDVSGNYETKDGALYPMSEGVKAGPGVLVAPTVPGIRITGLANDVQDLKLRAKTPVITGQFTPLDYIAIPAPGEQRIDAFFEKI